MATTATRKTYPVKYELFDTPDKIPAILAMALDEGFRCGVSAQAKDGEIEYRITATKVLGDDPDDPQAQVNRVSVVIGDVVVNDNGYLSQQEADVFLEAYDPPAAQVTKLEAARDERLAARAAKKAAVETPPVEEESPAQKGRK